MSDIKKNRRKTVITIAYLFDTSNTGTRVSSRNVFLYKCRILYFHIPAQYIFPFNSRIKIIGDAGHEDGINTTPLRHEKLDCEIDETICWKLSFLTLL